MRELRGSRGAINQRDAVEEKSGGKRAQQKILHGRFVGARNVAAIAGQNVGGDGAGLEPDEGGHQFGGAGHHAHARRGKEHQRVVFAVLDVFAVEIIGRAEHHQERDRSDDHVDEDAEAIDAQQARRTRCPDAVAG